VNLEISDSLFTHWLKSKDLPISTFLRIMEECNGELRIEDFVEDLTFNQGGQGENKGMENFDSDTIDLLGID